LEVDLIVSGAARDNDRVEVRAECRTRVRLVVVDEQHHFGAGDGDIDA
jgi:hypothetical protein